MAIDQHHGPRKMGVYEGAGTTQSQMPKFLAVLGVIVLLLLLWVFFQ
ncbi:hypothetical protein [Azospirillum halopraeferens]|nr:hypothetical protein [Azospirillum halopraeferens]